MTQNPKTDPNSDLPPRKAGNWLSTYLKHIIPVSGAPESFLIWTGLFCLAAVCKRNLQFSRAFTKTYTIHPTMYLIFVAPPGATFKSTTAGFAKDIFTEMNATQAASSPTWMNIGPTVGSASSIQKAMSETLDGSMVIVAGEFGNLVSITPEVSYDFFSNMFDHEESYTHSTRMYGDETTIKPSLNIFGCTTPDWMSLNSGYITGGGFAARTVFIFENRARQVKLFYDEDGDNIEKLDAIKKDLAYDLKIIGLLRGEFKPESKKLRDRMEEWFQEYRKEIPEKSAETFHQRKHIHTIRTAMLLSLSRSNSLIILEEDFNSALELIADVQKKLGRGLGVVAKNPYVQEHYKILDYIIANGPVLRSKVNAAFWQDVRDPSDFAGIIEVLKATGEIEEIDYGNGQKALRKTKA